MFRFKTIQTKIIVLIFSVFTLLLSTHILHQLNKIKADAFETLENINATVNTALVEYTSAYVYNNDIKNLKRTIDAIESIYIKSIYILNQDGIIIANNQAAETLWVKHPAFDTLLHTSDNSIKSRDQYLILNTFEILDVPIGYMLLEANLDTYASQVDNEIRTLMWITILRVIVFLTLAILIAKSLSRPIHEMIEKLQSTHDDEVLEFPDQAQKEFEYLASTIANTHNRLRTANTDLENEVHRKTLELQDLNRSLEDKVAAAITDIEYKNRLLQQQSRLAQMGEMISMIAHQWRQPLGAIASTAIDLKIKIELETFDLQTKESQDACNNYFLKQLDDIEHFVQNLTTTIDDFRNFYKPNKELLPVTLEVIIAKALNIIKTSLENDNVEIIFDYHSHEELELHDGEMIQVILNILKNAQDNFKEKAINKPQIKITTRENSFKICDNGGGIPEDIIDKIFDPYFSTKDAKNGTGLGLYMSKTIIEEHHNGALQVKNQDDGVCFTITVGENLNTKYSIRESDEP